MAEGGGDRGAPRILGPDTIEAGYTAARADLGRFNLGLFGITGAGKSTLLNAVFGADLAPTGIGAPVTQTSTLYRYASASLGIVDTKGLELGSGMADILRELTSYVEANRLGPEADQLHVIWYCVRAGDRRIQPAEADFIRRVSAIGIPVILVMTQTPLNPDGTLHADAAELAAAIRELKLPTRGDIFFVNALADAFAGVPVHGLDELLDWTSTVAPEGVRNALAAAQRINRRMMAERSESVVAAATERVRLKSLVPRRLGESWVAMFAEIAAIYGMSEATSREVLEREDTVPRLRKLIYASNAGIFLMPAVAVVGMAATSATEAGKKAAADRRERRGGAAARELDAGVDPATAQSPAPRTTVGSGLAARRTTRALGEAWATTCEHFWTESYPDPPLFSDTGDVADHFAAELASRMPAANRRRWGRRRKV